MVFLREGRVLMPQCTLWGHSTKVIDILSNSDFLLLLLLLLFYMQFTRFCKDLLTKQKTKTKQQEVILLQPEIVSCWISLSKNRMENTWCLANTMSLQSYNTMVRDFVFLCKMFIHSLWPCYHDSSKQKVKTKDIQNICSSVDYDFKEFFFIDTISRG